MIHRLFRDQGRNSADCLEKLRILLTIRLIRRRGKCWRHPKASHQAQQSLPQAVTAKKCERTHFAHGELVGTINRTRQKRKISSEHAPERSTPAAQKLIAKSELLELVPFGFITIWQ